VERALLSGMEHALLVWYALTLLMCERAFGSTLVGCCVVLLLDTIVEHSRRRWGRINTTMKTLLEDRYLV
jgi:hypothetical protein